MNEEQVSNDPWDVGKLGWEFGLESSALAALRGCLEFSDHSFQIGRHTLYDALREYSEVRQERDQLRQLVGPAKALLDIVGESEGVTGWHLNGAVAPWGEFAFVADFQTAIE